MLAIASLATGFVVAAVSPSHGAPAELPLGLDVEDTVSTVEDTVTVESLSGPQPPGGRRGRGPPPPPPPGAGAPVGAPAPVP
ncbi:hypothetical protein GCM10010385_07800 [Streptomyces geysiriensis]|nr:hypothetical protein GCM10010385_07800 [Streptomyces geysiriensis]